MTHDIAHCEGKNCSLKQDCKRYLAYCCIGQLEKNINISYISSEDCKNDYMKFYWKEDEK